MTQPNTPNEIEATVAEFEKYWSDFIGDIEFGEAFTHIAQDPEVPYVLPEMAHWLRTTLTQLNANRTAEMEAMVREMLSKSETERGEWGSYESVLTDDIKTIAQAHGITIN